MYCTKCGAKLEPNERFCPFCGEVADDSPEQPPAPPPAPSPEPQAPLPQPPVPDPGKRPMDKKLIVGAAAVAVVVLAIIAAAIFLLGGKEKPDDAAASPSPGLSFDPSGEPTESALPSEPSDGEPSSQPPEGGEPAQGSVSLSDLYIGAWVAEGCIIDDETNGWIALYLDSINGNAMTFTLEKVQSGPINRIATTYPITVTISDGKGTFPVNDSWGNSGMGTITVKGSALHVKVDITSPDMTAMWDVSMDADFYPARSTAPSGNPQQPQAPAVSEAPTPAPPTGLGTTVDAIWQEFENQSYRHGASFSVENGLFFEYDDGNSAVYQFDSRGVSVNFIYRFDRSYGEVSISDAQNPSKLTELANAAFLILSGNDDSTSFRGLPARVWDSEPEHYAVRIDQRAAELGDTYVETVTDTYTATYSADGYSCVFLLYHTYDSLQYGRSNDVYSGNIKFIK